MTQLGGDTFNRTSASGWGTADVVGGAWTITGSGVSTDFAVTPGDATILPRAGIDTGAQLVARTALNQEVLAKCANEGSATGLSPCVRLRCQGNAHYLVKAGYDAYSSFVNLRLYRTTDSVAYTNVVNVDSATTKAASQTIWIRAQATGDGVNTLIQARVWVDGSAEPTAWELTQTDSTAGIQAAGGAGCQVFGDGGGGVSAHFFSFSFGDLGQPPRSFAPPQVSRFRDGRRPTHPPLVSAPPAPAAAASLLPLHPTTRNVNLRR